MEKVKKEYTPWMEILLQFAYIMMRTADCG